MSTRIITKNFNELEVGNVIVDPQGKRCTITAIGNWEVFDDVWNGSTVVSARGRRIFYQYYSEVLGHTMDAESTTIAKDMSKILFQVEA